MSDYFVFSDCVLCCGRVCCSNDHMLLNLSVQPVLGVSRGSSVRGGRHHKSLLWNSNS